jgi:transposase
MRQDIIKVTDACYPRHRSDEFLRFLKQVAKAYPRVELHIVVDNYAAHKHPRVNAWLARNPRIMLHFTPTSGSWLNMVEIFFGIISRQAIRRGQLRLDARADRGDPPIHRWLERTLPTLRLDQDRRPNPAPRNWRSKNINHAKLAGMQRLCCGTRDNRTQKIAMHKTDP